MVSKAAVSNAVSKEQACPGHVPGFLLAAHRGHVRPGIGEKPNFGVFTEIGDNPRRRT